MPTYAYVCKDCDHAFDAVQSFSDESLTDCPECAGTLRKKFNSVGVVFKGSGFYRNDSRSGGSDSAGNSTSTAASSNSSDGSSGSDSTTGASGGSAGSDGSNNSSSSEKKRKTSDSSTSHGSGTAAAKTPATASA